MQAYSDNMPLGVGIIMLIAAAIMYLRPPKKINNLYGYRTPASKSSQEHWDFAQRFSAIRMMHAALALILAGVIFELAAITAKAGLILGIMLSLAACLYLVLTTEKALNNKFENTK